MTADQYEAKFYRDILEDISLSERNTRAKRLAKSALAFWDATEKEAKQRRKKR